jgi:hypothetical protein
VIREFKLGNREQLNRLAHLIAKRVPGLDETAAVELVNTSVVVFIGLWPFANSGPAVIEAIDDPRLVSSDIDFASSFSRTVQVLLAGLIQLNNA